MSLHWPLWSDPARLLRPSRSFTSRLTADTQHMRRAEDPTAWHGASRAFCPSNKIILEWQHLTPGRCGITVCNKACDNSRFKYSSLLQFFFQFNLFLLSFNGVSIHSSIPVLLHFPYINFCISMWVSPYDKPLLLWCYSPLTFCLFFYPLLASIHDDFPPTVQPLVILWSPPHRLCAALHIFWLFHKLLQHVHISWQQKHLRGALTQRGPVAHSQNTLSLWQFPFKSQTHQSTFHLLPSSEAS